MENSNQKEFIVVILLKNSTLRYHLLEEIDDIESSLPLNVKANLYDSSEGFNKTPIATDCEVIIPRDSVLSILSVEPSDCKFCYLNEEIQKQDENI